MFVYNYLKMEKNIKYKIKGDANMKDMDKIFEKGISSLVPIYKNEAGNSTAITTEDGESYIILKTLKTVLKILCKFYSVDITSVRSRCGKIINQKTVVPLPLSHNILLIPIKMRKPLFTRDGSYGYVNILSIEKIYKEDSTYIKLKNNHEIKCLCSLKTVKDHYNKGKIILNDPSFKRQYNRNYDNPIYYFYKELNSPATKGDIVGLKEEILAIRETLLRNTSEK